MCLLDKSQKSVSRSSALVSAFAGLFSRKIRIHRVNLGRKIMGAREVVLFDSPEEAWFWFVQGMKARNVGERLVSSGCIERPCSIDDIFLALARLVRLNLIRERHMRVLNAQWDRGDNYRHQEGDELVAKQAMNALGQVLQEKCIVSESWTLH